MPTLSAGILPYRIGPGRVLELFLAHPGGPYWAHKDDHAWSVVKGECDGEEAAAVADREFLEEVGVPAPAGARLDLGEIKQSNRKSLRIWAVHAPDFEVGAIVSNRFEIEWPPRSGRMQSFPEVDVAEWTGAGLARRRLVKGQVQLVDLLLASISEPGTSLREGPP